MTDEYVVLVEEAKALLAATRAYVRAVQYADPSVEARPACLSTVEDRVRRSREALNAHSNREVTK